MEETYIVEKDWITADNLRAVVIIALSSIWTKSHRCGYVGVPITHPMYAMNYNDVSVDCHGGLMYSGDSTDSYPVESLDSSLWWFGFDCAHLGDAPITSEGYEMSEGTVRTLDFCVKECESIASQLQKKEE